MLLQPVAYASKALTRSQVNYAQIKEEMLAIVFGCTRFHDYVYGLKEIHVETDHKPLEAILKKLIHQAPARLQRMILQIQKYPLVVNYRPGKELVLADTLSRAYVQDQTTDTIEDDAEVNLLSTLPISESKLKLIKDETIQDTGLQQLKEVVQKGWPDEKHKCPPHTLPYWNFRDELSVHDNILFRGERVIVPTKLRHSMLKIIHGTHLGIEKCNRDVLITMNVFLLFRTNHCLLWPMVFLGCHVVKVAPFGCSSYTLHIRGSSSPRLRFVRSFLDRILRDLKPQTKKRKHHNSMQVPICKTWDTGRTTMALNFPALNSRNSQRNTNLNTKHQVHIIQNQMECQKEQYKLRRSY